MMNTDLQRNLNALRDSQQSEKQWKEDVLSVLKSIDEKLAIVSFALIVDEPESLSDIADRMLEGK
jgi:hypothetical protein